MSGGGEQRGFVFSVVFIIVFATLLSSVPAGLQGPAHEPDTVVPIDPSILTGFAETEDFHPDNYTGAAPPYLYDYDFAGRSWRTFTDDDTFLTLAAKVFVWVFWFGALDPCNFVANGGTDRGPQLDFDEIDADDDNGTVRYSMHFSESGDSAGSLVVYWNYTEYSSIHDAWDNDEAYLLHGVGFENTATTNIGSLIVSLLFLQLPEVPVLVNIFLAVPIWACIIYVLWFIIKEMIPFV